MLCFLGGAHPACEDRQSLGGRGEVCNTFAFELQFDNCLNCLLLQVDTCVYLDAPILCVLLHARVEVTPVGIDVLPFCGIKQFPNVGQVVVAVDPHKTH